jgi:DNA-3-methyladenine glycosylase
MKVNQPVGERLSRTFYARSTVTVARALLGKRVVRVRDGQRLAGRIIESEAYAGASDAASHAHKGRTQRNAPMFGPPGHAYVYFIYGMHWMFNIVARSTDEQATPGAVLIRALEPIEGIETMQALRGGRDRKQLTSGPARLCQALDIDRRFDAADLCAPDARLFVEQDAVLDEKAIATGPRVGVRGDQDALSRPWRFYMRDNPYVSQTR